MGSGVQVQPQLQQEVRQDPQDQLPGRPGSSFQLIGTDALCSQEEDCNENFVKNCFIEYSKTAQNITVTVCRTPLVKDCDVAGEEVKASKDLTT